MISLLSFTEKKSLIRKIDLFSQSQIIFTFKSVVTFFINIFLILFVLLFNFKFNHLFFDLWCEEIFLNFHHNFFRNILRPWIYKKLLLRNLVLLMSARFYSSSNTFFERFFNGSITRTWGGGSELRFKIFPFFWPFIPRV